MMHVAVGPHPRVGQVDEHCQNLQRMVGESGFEPPTPWSRTRCSTRLSHSPMCWLNATLEGVVKRTCRSFHYTVDSGLLSGKQALGIDR
jgi:hypothetical protein